MYLNYLLQIKSYFPLKIIKFVLRKLSIRPVELETLVLRKKLFLPMLVRICTLVFLLLILPITYKILFLPLFQKGILHTHTLMYMWACI